MKMVLSMLLSKDWMKNSLICNKDGCLINPGLWQWIERAKGSEWMNGVKKIKLEVTNILRLFFPLPLSLFHPP